MPEKTIQKVNKLIAEELADPEKVKSGSSDAYGILQWVTNTINLYDVYKTVEPMRKLVADMTSKSEKNQRELIETQELIQQLDKQLRDLNERRVEKQTILDELTR